MLKITVSQDKTGPVTEQHSFALEQQGGSWLIDQQIFNGDIVRLSDQHFHVIWNNKSYNVEIVEANLNEKTFQVVINGRPYYTAAKDEIDLLLEGMGMQHKSAKKINHVKAPMPGLIQSISVGAGDQVRKDDILLVLVAMKMENVIKAAGDGIVKSLKVSAGETVEKNQVILEFE